MSFVDDARLKHHNLSEGQHEDEAIDKYWGTSGRKAVFLDTDTYARFEAERRAQPEHVTSSDFLKQLLENKGDEQMTTDEKQERQKTKAKDEPCGPLITRSYDEQTQKKRNTIEPKAGQYSTAGE